MKRTKSTYLALVVLISPMAANAVLIDIDEIPDGTSNTLLTATYTNPTQEGPLSFGLGAMPDEFSATFRLSIDIENPTACVPWTILCEFTGNIRHSVLSSSVTFGDATWTTLASFDFEVDANGAMSLDYAFQPLASTQTAVDPIVLNGPLMITGIDIASDETFTYGYGTRTLSLVQVPEPSTLALLGIGLAGMGLARRRKAV